jgi:hypothetical protein
MDSEYLNYWHQKKLVIGGQSGVCPSVSNVSELHHVARPAKTLSHDGEGPSGRPFLHLFVSRVSRITELTLASDLVEELVELL